MDSGPPLPIEIPPVMTVNIRAVHICNPKLV